MIDEKNREKIRRVIKYIGSGKSHSEYIRARLGEFSKNQFSLASFLAFSSMDEEARLINRYILQLKSETYSVECFKSILEGREFIPTIEEEEEVEDDYEYTIVKDSDLKKFD